MRRTEDGSSRRASTWALCVAVVVLAAAVLPGLGAPLFTPKAAIYPILAGVGLPILVWFARGRERTAMALLAFFATAVAATALSPQPALAVAGLYNWGTGLVFVGACAGAWALGARLDDDGARAIGLVLVAAALLNAFVAIFQWLLEPPFEYLDLFDGRAPGLLGNPVHLGAFSSAVALFLAASPSNWPRAAALVPVATATVLSGSRLPIVVVALLAPAAAVVFHRRPAFATVAAILLGLVAGQALVAASPRDVGTTAATERVSTDAVAGDIGPRAATWWSARHAIAERPVFGIGPGLFRAATSEYRPLSVARYAPDRYYLDAHNIFVEYVTTTGILGLLALGLFLVVAFASSRGPFVLFAIGSLASSLLQPQSSVTVLMFLALGAASGITTLRVERRRLPLPVIMSALLLGFGGAGLGLRLVAGDRYLQEGRLDYDLNDARKADELLWPWPQGAMLASQIFVLDAHPDANPAATDEAIRWYRIAVARDPQSPSAWNALGSLLYVARHLDEAEAAFLTALQHDPVSAHALRGLADVADARGDERAAKIWRERLSSVRQ